MTECVFCGDYIEGTSEYSIRMDSSTTGDEVPLCVKCGSGETPTCEEIWTHIRKTMVIHGGRFNHCVAEDRKPEHDFICIDCRRTCCWCFGSAGEIDEQCVDGSGLCCDCSVKREEDKATFMMRTKSRKHYAVFGGEMELPCLLGESNSWIEARADLRSKLNAGGFVDVWIVDKLTGLIHGLDGARRTA